jgi:hypothetical protein
LTRFLGGSINVFNVSHNKGVTTKLGGEHVFKFEESPQDKNDAGMCSLNFISYLIKPLMLKMFKIVINIVKEEP